MFKILTLIAGLALMLSSCKKDNYEPPVTQDLITQDFSLTLKTDVSPMDAKSWEAGTWVYNYSTVPATLTLTGTGASAGNTYTKSCTVAELKAGTVSFTMLPGTYTATFLTPHIWTTDSWALNGFTPAQLETLGGKIGDVLDIKIDNPGLVITGAGSIPLEATLEDALIIVDVPDITQVKASKEPTFSGNYLSRLLKDIPNDFHYAYVNQTPLYIKIINGTERIVDCSAYLKGNAYHLLANVNAGAILNIPGMILHDVIIP